MKQWFGEHKPKEDEDERVERRLRYAVVEFLDVTDGDYEWVADVVDLAGYQWGVVNNGN